MNYFKKTTLIFGWIAFALSALVYILTLEPSASLWDCSEFIATSYKMEVGHPPGAPLFMLLNRIFTIFAPDTTLVAMMVNIASAIASAFTIAFLFWSIAHLSRRLIGKSETEISTGETWAAIGAALVGSLGYAFTDTFWFSAVEGEVYAQSSLFTAMVFWAILKWENVADEPYANRWLVLVAYLMGLSIGVHLLNLLAIPAIVFVYYYRLNPVRSKMGWWKAFALSIVILAFTLYVIVPQTVSIGAWFDRVFVNTFGLPVNSGLASFVVLLLGALSYGVWYSYKKSKVILNTVLLCVTVMVIGYGSYATVVIRAVANPPMNSNNPDDPYALLSFLNREQYGNRPLFSGPTYASVPIDVERETTYVYDDSTKRYNEVERLTDYVYAPGTTTIFPRMYSPDHAEDYKSWASVKGRKMKVGEEVITLPTAGENLRYFVTYQLNFMYWRYFLWNFVGRQNDIQSQGEIVHGNWMSGITPIDELYLGPQKNLPDDLKNNKGRNHYYFLPFILGLIGVFYQLKKDRNNFTVVMWLFFMTGIAIILYLNQVPSQPRERDYTFAGSFYAFSIWMGIGVLWLFELLKHKLKVSQKTGAIAATVICLSVPVILIAQNWDDHDRSGRYVNRDIGADYLESTLPNTILLPYGDNDTFTLWYNQEVEGLRRDVRVMNLSYIEGDWYVEQMRDKSYESDPVPFTLPQKFYRDNDAVQIVELVKEPMTMAQILDFLKNDSKLKQNLRAKLGTDVIIPTRTILIPVNKQNAIKSGIIKAEEADLALDTLKIELKGSSLRRGKLALLDAITTADWNRPVAFTQPTVIEEIGLKKYLQADGFVFRLVPFETPGDFLNTGRIDTEYLYDVLMNKFKFGNIKDPKVYVDYFVEYTYNATQMRNIYGRLAKQLLAEGDTVRAVKVIDKVIEEVPFSKIKHNYNSTTLIETLYDAGETEKADALLDDFKKQIMQHINYYAQFKGVQASQIGQPLNESLIYLQNIYVIASNNGRTEIVEELEPYLQLLQR